MALMKLEPWFPWPREFLREPLWPEIEVKRGLNVYETDEDIVVEAQLPAVPADKVEVTTEGGMVRIKGEVEKKGEEEKKKKYYRKEAKRSFYYSTALPSRGDLSKAKAEMEDGMVRVTIPKGAEAKPKKIKVKTKK